MEVSRWRAEVIFDRLNYGQVGVSTLEKSSRPRQSFFSRSNKEYGQPSDGIRWTSCTIGWTIGSRSAIDGITNFLPTPTNRWTSYESPGEEDWLEIDFGKPNKFRRVDLSIYDDRGGVQSPTEYEIQTWQQNNWILVKGIDRNP